MRKSRGFGMYVGGTSVLMVFAVLCLTVFAALSILSARSGEKLAQSKAEAATAYYAADSRATELMERIASGDESAAERVENGTYYYSVDIDGNQKLSVALLRTTDGSLKIMEWKVVPTSEWSPDMHINVWDGTAW